MVDYVWNVIAQAQKPDFFFRRDGRAHLNRRGCQFSRLLADEVCASAVAVLDTTSSEVVWRVLAIHSIRQFPLRFPSRASPCAITFQLDSTATGHTQFFPLYHYFRRSVWPPCKRRGSAAARLLVLRVRIPIPRGGDHGCLSLVSVLWYQVEVSVTGWSLVQRSPTGCVVSECDHEVSITPMPWSTGGCCAMERTGSIMACLIWVLEYKAIFFSRLDLKK